MDETRDETSRQHRVHGNCVVNVLQVAGEQEEEDQFYSYHAAACICQQQLNYKHLN